MILERAQEYPVSVGPLVMYISGIPSALRVTLYILLLLRVSKSERITTLGLQSWYTLP